MQPTFVPASAQLVPALVKVCARVCVRVCMCVVHMCERPRASAVCGHVRARVQILKSLTSGGMTAEYDVAGVNDPFLQVCVTTSGGRGGGGLRAQIVRAAQSKCLELLRILGSTGGADAVEAMNGILTQVRGAQRWSSCTRWNARIIWRAVLRCPVRQIATATDGSRNSGNAVLYECVSTIMNVEAEVRSARPARARCAQLRSLIIGVPCRRASGCWR